MHRYIARLIGCVILASGSFLLPVLLAPRINDAIGSRNQVTVTVRTNGGTSDIVAAIETLKREDLSINIRKTDMSRGVTLITMMTGMLWVACGIVKRMEQSLSPQKKQAENQFSAPGTGT
jgi:hypothetical protein